ncbi:MAG: PAS domain-containing sensor histidine kinase [Zavarzinia sp.]|nr:PAS domain-containing sensor histidine kinase [Zavarzinia sp.]
MNEAVESPRVSRAARLEAWISRSHISRRLVVFLVLLAAASGTGTYLALRDPSVQDGNTTLIIPLLLTDLVLVLALAALVATRIVRLWWARRSGLAGAKLHVRIVALFGAIAAVPTIFLGVASALFFNLIIDTWFSARVQGAVSDSVTIAKAYVEEHSKTIEADIRAMANDINRRAMIVDGNSDMFNLLLENQAAVRGLAEAIVINSTGRVLARTALSFGMEFDRLPAGALDRAGRDGEVVIITTEDDRVRALIRLDSFLDAFLYVGRFVDPRVIAYVERTQAAVAEYEELQKRRLGIQVTFAFVFVLVGLLILLTAILAGLWVATRLVEPVARLFGATERLREGDLSARVDTGTSDDELASLGRAFNRMAGQIEAQHGELRDANHQLDERRRFTEAVLAGVSAGVLGVDIEGRITLPNRSALELLQVSAEEIVGERIADVVPEIAALMAEVRERPDREIQAQINLARGGVTRHFSVRVVGERAGRAVRGFVVTFDDVTDLVSAQRTAAWADIARRIAHEIRNPLTPIQLSAERLKRKYGREIATDPEVFAQCTDTIIRQVGDIGRMVDEFSAFARMPTAVFRMEDLSEQVRQAVFLRHVAAPGIVFETALPPEPVRALFDMRQIGQALTNVLKNAAEAIEARPAAPDLPQGRVMTTLSAVDGTIRIEVRDNGRGLPVSERDRLTEPYVTTRAKGTGLGLAIVRKILEEHGGTIVLGDNPGGGAVVTLSFPWRHEAAGAVREVEARTAHGS